MYMYIPRGRYVCMYACMHVCMYVCVRVCVCVCMCTCIIGLVDVVAVKKDGNHLQLIKASYKHFVAPGDADAERGGGDRHFLTRKARAVKHE